MGVPLMVTRVPAIVVFSLPELSKTGKHPADGTHELPSVRGYLGTGAYSYRDDGWEGRDDLPYVLSTTQRGDTLNIVVRVGVAPKQLG